MWGIGRRDGATCERAVKSLLRRGVIVLMAGPLGNVLHLTPPLVIPKDDLIAAVDTIEEIVGMAHAGGGVAAGLCAQAGLSVLTVGFARAFGPAVRVNTIVPGPFLTDISRAWDMDAFERMAEAQIPLPQHAQVVVDSQWLWHGGFHTGTHTRYAMIATFESGPELERWIESQLPAQAKAAA